MARTGRILGRTAALGLLALLLGACLKLDMDLQVSTDNTVNGTVIFGVNKELLELTGGSAEDLLGTDAPLPEDAEGVTSEPFEDDEFAGRRFTFEAVPLSEFSSDDPNELQITRDGNVFRVAGALDLSSGVTGATGATGLGAEQFLQGAELEITISFPGEVTESNGEIDGNAVTWIPVVGERLELRATASAIETGGASNLTPLIVAAAMVVAAVVAGVVLARRRRRPPVATGFGERPAAPPAPPAATATLAGAGTERTPAPPAPPGPASGTPPPPPPPGDRQP